MDSTAGEDSAAVLEEGSVGVSALEEAADGGMLDSAAFGGIPILQPLPTRRFSPYQKNRK
jgi:hypothetical protein